MLFLWIEKIAEGKETALKEPRDLRPWLAFFIIGAALFLFRELLTAFFKNLREQLKDRPKWKKPE